MSTSVTLSPPYDNWWPAQKSWRFEAGAGAGKKLLTLFGTRPEVIKLAPVIHQLEAYQQVFQTINVSSSQHTDLLYPFIKLFDLRIDYDLQVMSPQQPPNQLCSRLLSALDAVLAIETPDLMLVQGDTSTALAGALAGFHRRIPVAHVEAGLRSGNAQSPFPEEMNRRLISQLATYHFAPTEHNHELLRAEGVASERIFVTGNPVVDTLHMILERFVMTPALQSISAATKGFKRIVLTTHRRESFGELMWENMRVLRAYVESHAEVALIFPVHPNPQVVEASTALLSGHPRIHLIAPLNYDEFIMLLSSAWLIVSDSGGVQEEAPTLGKPLLILRDNTERPEVLQSGVARLVGGDPQRLAALLEEVSQEPSWADAVQKMENPFGQGDSGGRIAQIVAALLGLPVSPATVELTSELK